MTIAREDRSFGSRLGGNPPRGVTPPIVLSSTRYFATVELGKGCSKELSLFLSIDYAANSSNSLWNNRFKMHSTQSPLVQLVLHAPAPRATDPALCSELSSHCLAIQGERIDSESPDENLIWNHHKIGGYPFFHHYRNPMVADANTLEDSGYLHLLQFAFPDSEDGLVSGDWPFAEFVFHVFAKPVVEGVDYHYCWG